jgi:hypothetical protein
VEETNLFLKIPDFYLTKTMALTKTFASSVRKAVERIGSHATIATSGTILYASALLFCQKMMRFTYVLIAKIKKNHLMIYSMITESQLNISFDINYQCV